MSYSVITHLFSALFGNRDGIVALLTGYFDASGTKDDPNTPVLVVGGFVSTVDQWERFNSEWSECLTQFGVPYLHMKEYTTCRGPFASWKGDESKRRNFLDRLSGIIARRTRLSICIGIPNADYNAVNKDVELQESFGCSYSLCGLYCVGLTEIWKKEYEPEKPVLYLFEKGDHGRDELERHMKEKFNNTPVFVPKNGNEQFKGVQLAFQAADYAAYENRLLFSREIKKGDDLSFRDFRGSATCLYDKLKAPEHWGMVRGEDLRNIALKYGAHFRENNSDEAAV